MAGKKGYKCLQKAEYRTNKKEPKILRKKHADIVRIAVRMPIVRKNKYFTWKK